MTPEKIKQLTNVQNGPAVTLLLGSRGVYPEHNRDRIALKNLITEAERRLSREYPKDITAPLFDKMRKIETETDHRYNGAGMAVFVSPQLAEVIKLPVLTPDKVLIGNKFHIREVLRAMQQAENFYVLCLSPNRVRLIEKTGETEKEITHVGFPVINEYDMLNDGGINRPNDVQRKHYIEDFFAQAATAFKNYANGSNLPVIAAGTQENIRHYVHANGNVHFAGHVEGSYDLVLPHNIVEKAKGAVATKRVEEQGLALKEISDAQNNQRLLDDLGDIYRAAVEGNGHKLFVEAGYYQPATIQDKIITTQQNGQPASDDDVINEIVLQVLSNGGQVTFLDDGQLTHYRGIALITRYQQV